MPQPRSGLVDLLAATVIAGLASYVITWLVPRVIGFAEYSPFAAFWAAMYLVVGTVAGVQQEIARATSPTPAPIPSSARVRTVALVTAGVVFVIGLATTPLWSGPAFPPGLGSLGLPLAVGVAGYALLAVAGGTLQGLARWRATAVLILTDALLRLVAIGLTLAFTHDVVALAWAAALPFGLSLAIVWSFVRSRVAGRAHLDVGYRALSANIARTVLAAASTSIMVSGFPFVLSLGAAHEPAALVGLVVLSATLVRAPLVVISMSLQNWFLVRFRNDPSRARPLMGAMLGGIAATGLVLAAVAWAAGPAVFGWLFPAEPVPGGLFLAALVASSALVAAVFITGSGLLALSRHHAFSAGWVAGAIVTVVGVFIPLPLEERVSIALLAGPGIALAVHAVALLASRSRGIGEEQLAP